MKRGLIPSQIGFAERVRPQGEIQLVWESLIREQLERDEYRRFIEGEMACDMRYRQYRDPSLWQRITSSIFQRDR